MLAHQVPFTSEKEPHLGFILVDSVHIFHNKVQSSAKPKRKEKEIRLLNLGDKFGASLGHLGQIVDGESIGV